MSKSKISILAIATLLLGVSCTKYKDFGDTNVNPGGSQEPIPSALFSNVSAGVAGAYATTTMVNLGYYSQYFSETQYSDRSLYSIPQIEFSGIYSGHLYDLQNIININSNSNLTQASRILKSYIFWTITDRWGDVPYSEALKGNEIKSPKYDPQEDIYKGILAELTDAVSKFDNTTTVPGDISDYRGNIDQWKKLGNSLRVLVALQMSKRHPSSSGLAATELKAALTASGGVITENADNLVYSFPGGNLANPWYTLYNGRKDVGESNTMTALMTSLGDGRQTAFASDFEGNSTTTGVPYGWARDKVDPWTQANPKWAYVLDDDLRKDNSPVVVIPASVVTLARAEAADRGWTSENALNLYRQGITLSYQQWGIGTPAATYFTQSAVTLTAAQGSGANVNKIALQHYIAGYPNGHFGWNLWRRTGVPTLTPAVDAVNTAAGKTIPRRYTYGTGEYSSNAANVAAAVQRLVPPQDVMNARFWWDQ